MKDRTPPTSILVGVGVLALVAMGASSLALGAATSPQVVTVVIGSLVGGFAILLSRPRFSSAVNGPLARLGLSSLMVVGLVVGLAVSRQNSDTDPQNERLIPPQSLPDPSTTPPFFF